MAGELQGRIVLKSFTNVNFKSSPHIAHIAAAAIPLPFYRAGASGKLSSERKYRIWPGPRSSVYITVCHCHLQTLENGPLKSQFFLLSGSSLPTDSHPSSPFTSPLKCPCFKTSAPDISSPDKGHATVRVEIGYLHNSVLHWPSYPGLKLHQTLPLSVSHWAVWRANLWVPYHPQPFNHQYTSSYQLTSNPVVFNMTRWTLRDEIGCLSTARCLLGKRGDSGRFFCLVAFRLEALVYPSLPSLPKATFAKRICRLL